MNQQGTLKIPYKSLSVGDHHFEFTVGDGFFEAFEGSPVSGGENMVKVDAQRKTSGMNLVFSIEGEALVQCDRCLEPLSLPVKWEGELPVKVDSSRVGEYDGETVYISPGEESVEVSQWVYESICLSLPIIKVHGEDPGGVSLCDPDMLSRFRIVTPSEFDSLTAERE